MESFRLGVGLDAQLAFEHFRGRLVLLQRVDQIAALHVEPHQSAVDRLLKNVDAQRALSGGDRFVDRPSSRLHLQELHVTAQGHAMQPVALCDHPLVETLFVDLKTVEQITAIQMRRFRQRLFRPRCDERFERRDVARHQRFIESEEIVFLDENFFVGGELAKLLAQRGERLPKALPRLIGSGAAPEQHRDFLARNALRRLHAEISDERLRLFRRNREQRSGRGSHLEITEELEL